MIRRSFTAFILIGAIIYSAIFFLGFSYVNGVSLFNDEAFGVTFDGWIEKYWSWWIGVPLSDFDGGMKPLSNCLINNSDSMVMLMETIVKGNPNQDCVISTKQGILIPIWTGYWWETKEDMEANSWTDEYLLMNAQSSSNAGQIKGSVKIDGNVIANLHADSSKDGVKYFIKENITEVGAKGFNLTIPVDSHTGDPAGTYPSAVHGWFVFLEPLPKGDHTIFYEASVGEGQNKDLNKAKSGITYLLHVKD